MLCFTVLNVCGSASTDNQYFGLAIAFVVVAGGYSVGAISGGVFNPAVGLGVNILSIGRPGWGYCILYTAAQILGAGMASFLYKIVRPEDYDGEAKSLTARLTAEGVGTYLLMTTVGFSVLTQSAALAYCIGACLMVNVYSLGNCSGGHFNPAVTLTAFLAGKISQTDALKYMGVQAVSALAGALTYTVVTSAAFSLAPKMPWPKVALAEVIFTFLLCFVVLNVACVAKPSKDMFGLAIGSVLVAALNAGGAIGICMNPAVGLGIDFANMLQGGQIGTFIPYTALEFTAAALAAQTFVTLRPSEKSATGKPTSAV